jgi:hypothetical protein
VKTLLLSLLLGAGCFPGAYATNYYVSGGAGAPVAGVNSTAGGRGLSPTLPFATIQYAADLTLPGDTVFVRAGTYTNPFSFSPGVDITRSGAPGQWIVYRNYPADAQKPLLKFNGWQGFKLSGNIAYIELNGFRIQGNNSAINNPDGTPNPAAALNQPGGCAVNGVGTPLAIYNGDGIGVGGSTVAGSQNPHHLRFLNNEVFECGGGGIIVAQADYVTIENNLVYNTCWYTKYATSGISVLQSWNFDTAPGYRVVIRNNRCFGNRLYVPWWRGGTFGCAGFTDGNGIIIDKNTNTTNGSQLGPYTGRTLVANNLVVNNGGSGIHALYSAHIDIINNTSYGNSQTPSIDDGEVYGNQSADMLIQNNILVAAPGKRLNSNNRNTGVTYVNNLFFGGTTAAVPGTNTVLADPQFVNATTNWATADFRLRPTSPAINAGVNNLLSPVDLAGNPRLVGANVDLGAYEHQTVLRAQPAHSSAAWQLFPNPAHHAVELRGPALAAGATVYVFDALGRRCLTHTVAAETTRLSVAHLRPGIYTVQVQTKEGRVTQRLEIK